MIHSWKDYFVGGGINYNLKHNFQHLTMLNGWKDYFFDGGNEGEHQTPFPTLILKLYDNVS